MVSLADIDAELPSHDVIVLAAPQTPETEGLLNAARLALLARDAIVVNVSRGALVDEPALTRLLEAGAIRGAVLDVFRSEPLAAESILWQLRNVVVTPHISPVSPGRFWPRQLELFLDNWERYRRGEALRNVVDKQGGY
jgi:phosphoglycerate dehydrogenase-like enzyme